MQFQFIEEINRSYIKLRVLSNFNKKYIIHAFSVFPQILQLIFLHSQLFQILNLPRE